MLRLTQYIKLRIVQLERRHVGRLTATLEDTMETELMASLTRLRDTAEAIALLLPAVGVGLLVLRELLGRRW